VLGINWQWQWGRSLFSWAIAAMLVVVMAGCGDRAPNSSGFNSPETSRTQVAGTISEVSPPEVIQQLRQKLEIYQPQVSIISPQADAVLPDTAVEVRFQVKDLPIFQNPDLGLGPHLHVLLDNRTYQAVYDLTQPLIFKDLLPGTHTLRAFASRPWHESFKNEGAYAQTTFHVLAKTGENQPDPAQPLLTYSRPQGSYGAEPIMLDFYLTNAPLHLVAQANSQDEIADWRVRATVNGESFVLDQWQSIYLKGFKPGKNLVSLEFLDEQGNPVPNTFNNTARLIIYEPQGKDTLSKLLRGEISVTDALGIVDPNYKVKVQPSPKPSPSVTPKPSPSVTPKPSPSVTPKPSPSVTPKPSPSVTPKPSPSASPKPSPSASPKPSPSVSPKPSPSVTPKPSPSVSPKPSPSVSPKPSPSITPTPVPDAVETGLETPAPETEEKQETKKPKIGSFLNRFWNPSKTEASPEVPQSTPAPEVLKAPKSEPATPVQVTPQPEQTKTPKVENSIPEVKATPSIEVETEKLVPAIAPKTEEVNIPSRYLQKPEISPTTIPVPETLSVPTDEEKSPAVK